MSFDILICNEVSVNFTLYIRSHAEVKGLKKHWVLTGLAIGVAIFGQFGMVPQEAGREQYVSPWKTPWDYQGARGAGHWSDLDPDYAICNTGKEQSPIDIRNAEKADLPRLRFESKSGPLRYVTNNAHTIRVNYHEGNGNYFFVGDQRYELVQFHFHHPSEESIDGKAPEMDVHLMYRSADKKVIGVTVLVRSGNANSTVETLWEHMPKVEGQQEVAGVEISPGALLPRDTSGYYMYAGSVSAPPCTEGITWFVLKKPISLSAEQIKAFAELYPDNARPVQPLNGRVVKQSR